MGLLAPLESVATLSGKRTHSPAATERRCHCNGLASWQSLITLPVCEVRFCVGHPPNSAPNVPRASSLWDTPMQHGCAVRCLKPGAPTQALNGNGCLSQTGCGAPNVFFLNHREPLPTMAGGYGIRGVRMVESVRTLKQSHSCARRNRPNCHRAPIKDASGRRGQMAWHPVAKPDHPRALRCNVATDKVMFPPLWGEPPKHHVRPGSCLGEALLILSLSSYRQRSGAVRSQRGQTLCAQCCVTD